MPRMLDIQRLKVMYGQVQAIRDVSLFVDEGETVSVLGVNGAGKTTMLNTIIGIIRAASGDVFFEGKNICKMPPHQIARLGIGYVPEGRRVFSDLTVADNLRVGAYTIRDDKMIKRQLGFVFELFPVLQERTNQIAGTLSGGEQQMLAMGRALMLNPKLLLLDEPSMGLAPLVINDIFKALKEINRQGTTILLVEQSAYLALKISTRAYVIESGYVSIEDTVDNLIKNPEIKKSYLGL